MLRQPRSIVVAALLTIILVACSGPEPADIVAGTGTEEPGVGDSQQPVLQAVLEPLDALVSDFGSDWDEVDRWYTEGAMTHWGTGCSGFDRLGDIFNHGTPQTVVWANGDRDLYQRTDDFNWDAAEFADAVEAVPTSCPSVDIGSTTVSVSAVDPASLGSAVEQITNGDPRGRLVAIKFDAYPHASVETDMSTPEFEPGRSAWMVIATRHNVVSQIVFGPAARSTADALAELVAAQVEALLATPVAATGPFEKSPPPPSVPPGTAVDVELFVDPVTCRNDGYAEVDGIRWALAEAVPHEWREQIPIHGDLEMDGTTALFSAYPGPPTDSDESSTGEEIQPLDGFTVNMTTGAVPAVCDSWDQPEPVAPTSTIGQLDCDDRPIHEAVIPDDGQAVEELAFAANDQVVSVRPDAPLQWSALDGGGHVVAALFLGDAPDAPWQVFTCG